MNDAENTYFDLDTESMLLKFPLLWKNTWQREAEEEKVYLCSWFGVGETRGRKGVVAVVHNNASVKLGLFIPQIPETRTRDGTGSEARP